MSSTSLIATSAKHLEYAAEHVLGRLRWAVGARARAALMAASPELGRAIDEALRSHRAPDDAALADRIEELRRRAMRSREPIEHVDFGAGKAGEVLSAEAMAEGRVRQRTVADMSGASKSPFWAGVLFRLVKNLRVQKALELGTCIGVSAAYQAGAMALNGRGHVWTLEGSPALAEISRRHLAGLGLDERVTIVLGRFADTLDGVMKDHGPFDFVFIDGHHDEAATATYFEQIHPYMGERGVVAFDDIDWSPGMKRAWARLADDPRLPLTVDLGRIGIAQLGVAPAKVKLRVR